MFQSESKRDTNWISWQTFISVAKNYLKQNQALQVLSGLSLFDVLTAEHFVWLLTSLRVKILKALNKMLHLGFWKSEDNLAFLCRTWFKVLKKKKKKMHTRRNVQMLCRAAIMHEHLTYFPYKHVPHLLITFTQRTAWHISHINTSSVPEGEAAPSISLDPLVWEHLETFKEDVCGIKTLLMKYHSSQKVWNCWGFKRPSMKIPRGTLCFSPAHTFTVLHVESLCERCTEIRCAGMKDVEHSEQPITRDGLCHLPARLAACCLSGQLA